jgi:hypothetical protein
LTLFEYSARIAHALICDQSSASVLKEETTDFFTAKELSISASAYKMSSDRSTGTGYYYDMSGTLTSSRWRATAGDAFLFILETSRMSIKKSGNPRIDGYFLLEV